MLSPPLLTSMTILTTVRLIIPLQVLCPLLRMVHAVPQAVRSPTKFRSAMVPQQFVRPPLLGRVHGPLTKCQSTQFLEAVLLLIQWSKSPRNMGIRNIMSCMDPNGSPRGVDSRPNLTCPQFSLHLHRMQKPIRIVIHPPM